MKNYFTRSICIIAFLYLHGLTSSLACTAPDNAGSIQGKTTFCQGEKVTFTVPKIGLAISYKWIFPSNTQIISGTYTDSITVIFNGAGGTIRVQGINTCDTGVSSSLQITVNPLPIISLDSLNVICISAGIVNLSTLANAKPQGGCWRVINKAGFKDSTFLIHGLKGCDSLNTFFFSSYDVAGKYLMEYEANNGSCTSKQQMPLQIFVLPSIDISLGPRRQGYRFCETDGDSKMNASPAGGVWTSSISSAFKGSMFQPSAVDSAYLDKWVSLTYTYQHPITKCDSSKSFQL